MFRSAQLLLYEDPPLHFAPGEQEKEERGDRGETDGDPELTASEEGKGKNEEAEEESTRDENKRDEAKNKEINEMLEPEFDDEQTDPYHGQQPELPEPEPMDLPDDLQCDDQEEEQNNQQENPFDIDKQKGSKIMIYKLYFRQNVRSIFF